MYRAIIVDDEELSTKRLGRLLAGSGRFEVKHTFYNPLEACDYVRTNPVDIAFLDISMPGITGMKLSGLLRDLSASIEIVFVTGHDEYAVEAFEVNALDYLLKPVTVERLTVTLKKLDKNRGCEPALSDISVTLFGGFKIYRRSLGQEPVKLRTPKTEELLALLICKKTVSREEIIDLLWRELDVEKAMKNLNSTLYYIRKALGSDKMDGWIKASRNEIAINEKGMHCDLFEFEAIMKRLRSSSPVDLADIQKAEELYIGPFLKGKTYEWADEETRRLEQENIHLLEIAAAFHRERKNLQQALYYCGEILKYETLREDIHYEAIRLYLELGRKSEAFGQFRRLEERLHRELGTEPDPRITKLLMDL